MNNKKADKVLTKIMSRKGGMLVMQAYPWPIIYDTAAETSIFCAETHRPKGIELHRSDTHFYYLTGVRVGDVELPPIHCQMVTRNTRSVVSIRILSTDFRHELLDILSATPACNRLQQPCVDGGIIPSQVVERSS